MHFKNLERRTIFVSGGLGLLQMVSEPETEQCTSEDAGPQRGGLCDLTSIGKGNITFFIRTWRSLSSRHVLKTSKEISK